MRPPELCLYVVGKPPGPVEREFGDFEAWFRRLVGSAPVRLTAIDGCSGELPTDLDRFAAFVITGSPASLVAPQPWMEAGLELVRRAHGRGAPLLGVCFGHQMIGAALGGRVIVNSRGWELGTFDIDVLPEGRSDPLFAGLPARFTANLSHRDIIDPSAAGAIEGIRVLASSAKTALQAIAVGDATRGVQFHPELDGAITRAYLHNRAETIRADARERGASAEEPELLAARTRDCPLAERIFENFIRHWVC